jgi:hypothetical protein
MDTLFQSESVTSDTCGMTATLASEVPGGNDWLKMLV